MKPRPLRQASSDRSVLLARWSQAWRALRSGEAVDASGFVESLRRTALDLHDDASWRASLADAQSRLGAFAAHSSRLNAARRQLISTLENVDTIEFRPDAMYSVIAENVLNRQARRIRHLAFADLLFNPLNAIVPLQTELSEWRLPRQQTGFTIVDRWRCEVRRLMFFPARRRLLVGALLHLAAARDIGAAQLAQVLEGREGTFNPHDAWPLAIGFLSSSAPHQVR